MFGWGHTPHQEQTFAKKVTRQEVEERIHQGLNDGEDGKDNPVPHPVDAGLSVIVHDGMQGLVGRVEEPHPGSDDEGLGCHVVAAPEVLVRRKTKRAELKLPGVFGAALSSHCSLRLGLYWTNQQQRPDQSSRVAFRSSLVHYSSYDKVGLWLEREKQTSHYNMKSLLPSGTSLGLSLVFINNMWD